MNSRAHRGVVGALLIAPLSLSFGPEIRADIPWPEVVQRLAYENEKLARRPQGHNGEYFVVCTLYYTPKESGFTFARGFDATPVTKPGLHGRTYPRDFLRSVKKEGFGRTVTPVTDDNTFVTTVAVRLVSPRTLQAEAESWSTDILPRRN
ncbi:MAG: hypothetical protein DME93_04125 [Verrucomicrobia bacterium]|nr:MAG: hypothetical protein DME93_04125 [Verrucomicrobiota bacterium]